jgi:hypothetical protein
LATSIRQQTRFKFPGLLRTGSAATYRFPFHHEYPKFTIYPAEGGNGVGRWGDYSAAVADGNRIWFAAEYIPNACPTLTNATCRTSLANWGTFFATVNPFGF